MGEIWGSGVSANGRLDATSENQQAESLEVSQLYMTLTQEFGSLIVGRAPLHFGLGMTHNSGDGMFDHWYDTRDLVGYKIVFGNVYFFPMLAKVNEGDLHSSDEASDLLGHLQYENPESGWELGVFYWSRGIAMGANDANGTHGYGTGSITGKYDVKTTSFYLRREIGSFSVGVEVATQSGSTGVADAATGKNVDLSGQGVAVEWDWTPKDNLKWSGGVDLGYASGDDPKTTDRYEGFIFDRNYDVAFLMFNHPLGTADYLRTAVVTGRTDFDFVDVADIEAMSNVVYFSPHFTYRLSDRWLMDTRLTTGWLNKDPLDAGVKKDLGYELDFSFRFSPNHRVTWINGVGVLFVGEAFKGGSNNFDTDLGFGLMSKAAVSF